MEEEIRTLNTKAEDLTKSNEQLTESNITLQATLHQVTAEKNTLIQQIYCIKHGNSGETLNTSNDTNANMVPLMSVSKATSSDEDHLVHVCIRMQNVLHTKLMTSSHHDSCGS